MLVRVAVIAMESSDGVDGVTELPADELRAGDMPWLP